jgi:hypothetical protein
MKFPVNSLLAGNLRTSETGSLETASSSGESGANLTSSIVVGATDPFSGPPAEYHDKLTAVKTFALAINESAKAPCAGLQPGQLYADAGAAENDGAVVADQPAREADQDRRKGRHPRSLRHFPGGRGGGVATDVPGISGYPAGEHKCRRNSRCPAAPGAIALLHQHRPIV